MEIQKNNLSELVALATYIDDKEFLNKLKSESFRGHVWSQREFIKKILLNGFSLIENSSDLDHEQGFEKIISPSQPILTELKAPLKLETFSSPSPKLVQAEVEIYIQSLIVTKTGYPLDMVLFDVDLDDELGIDTVKKMEILGDLGSHYKLPLNADINLSQLTTVKKIAEIVCAKYGS